MNLLSFYPFIPQVSIHQSDGNGSITCFHSSALKFLGISNDEAQKLAKEKRTRGNSEIYRICKKKLRNQSLTQIFFINFSELELLYDGTTLDTRTFKVRLDKKSNYGTSFVLVQMMPRKSPMVYVCILSLSNSFCSCVNWNIILQWFQNTNFFDR